MFDILTRKWWVLAVQGIISIVFGIVALMAPESTLGILVIFVGAYALLDGVFALAAAFGEARQDRLWLIVGGVSGIAIGILTFVSPGLALQTFVYVVAYWAIITGVFRIIAGIEAHTARNWLFALSGAASVLFGILVLFNPAGGALTIVWLVGIYAVAFGAMQVVMAWRMRSARKVTAPQGVQIGQGTQ